MLMRPSERAKVAPGPENGVGTAKIPRLAEGKVHGE